MRDGLLNAYWTWGIILITLEKNDTSIWAKKLLTIPILLPKGAPERFFIIVRTSDTRYSHSLTLYMIF